MPPDFIRSGFTLVELLIVVAIVTATALIATPSFHNFIHGQQRHAATAELVRLLNTARSVAIGERTTVTVCPLDLAGECTNKWTEEVAAFRDPFRHRKVEHEGQMIRSIPATGAEGYREGATGIFNYLSFRATGRANAHIGNIIWCPSDKDERQATQVVVNWGGRVRVATDSNNDGVVENADGSPVQCP